MGDKRTKQRITSKIDELPEDLRMKVDVMLADTSNTYEYISQFLKGEGYDISKSSVGRYATRTNNAMQRLLEAQAQTDRLIQVVKENPEADYTEGEASPELIRKVGEAIEPLKGNYEDYLVKSSEVVRQDFELVIYLAEDAATDGVDAQATKLIEDMMALTRGEMNTLYRDSIIQVLSTKIDNYRKTDILQPSDDMVLEQDKVIMAGDINVTVRNVVQSARGKE